MSRLAGPIRQLGIIVRNLDQEIDHWAKIGVGPFVVIPRVRFENYRYRGTAMTGPVCSLAVSYSGPLQIEIIEQHDTVHSAYTEYLALCGGGLQHVSAWTDSKEEYDLKLAQLCNSGLELVHEGNVEGYDLRFAYFAVPGVRTFPLYEISEANLPSLRPLWAKLEAAVAAWDGTNPRRSMAEL